MVLGVGAKKVVEKFFGEALCERAREPDTDHVLLHHLLMESDFWITIRTVDVGNLMGLFDMLLIWETPGSLQHPECAPYASLPGVLEAERIARLLYERGTIPELPAYIAEK